MSNNVISNFDWLSETCGIQAQSWHQDKVLKASQIENSKFYKRERDYYDDYINPAQIVGIEYGYAYNCFNEITWLDLINALKRFDRIRRNMSSLDELLDHAHNDYNETKTVAKYGNQYITLAGQHRLALCKFLGIQSVKVSVAEHPFDSEMYNRYLARKSFLDDLIIENLINSESYDRAANDDGNYTSILIRGKYIWIKPQCFNSFINLYRDLKINHFTVSLSLLNQRLFGGLSTHNNNIESEKDMARFKDFLRLIKSGHIG